MKISNFVKFQIFVFLIFRCILSRMTPAGSTAVSASSSPCFSLILRRFLRSNLSNFLCPVLVCATLKLGCNFPSTFRAPGEVLFAGSRCAATKAAKLRNNPQKPAGAARRRSYIQKATKLSRRHSCVVGSVSRIIHGPC